jgi:hypothetical protein
MGRASGRTTVSFLAKKVGADGTATDMAIIAALSLKLVQSD